MLSLITWGFLAQLFISSANSQNNSAATCADINGYVQYNSSTTRQLQALKLQGNRTSENYAVVNDSSRIWELSYRVQKQPTNHNTYKSNNDGKHFYGTMFLDTKDSNMTNLGSCHQTLQAEIGGQGYTLSKLVLERSVNDNGDCTAMLGQDCVSAIKQRSMYQASEWPLRTGSCARMNGTIPAECDGLGLRPFMSARQMNNAYFDGGENGYSNSRFDPSLECNSVNASSTHILTVTDRMSYDPAVRFPVIDIITFWPNRSSGLQTYSTSWMKDVQVELVCMRPTSVAEGSTIPPTEWDLLNNKSINFPEPSSASSVTYGMLGWISAAVTGVILML